MVQVMLQPRRDHGTTGASGNGVIDDVVFLHRAVPGTCRLAIVSRSAGTDITCSLTPRVLTNSPLYSLLTIGPILLCSLTYARDSRLQRLLWLELRRARRHAGARGGSRAAGKIRKWV
jgi:hypothetical protein